MYLRSILICLCLLVTVERADYKLSALSFEIANCCCETTEHSDACSECPEDVASDYCGCKDFSLIFIAPDFFKPENSVMKGNENDATVYTPLECYYKPDTPPPKLI